MRGRGFYGQHGEALPLPKEREGFGAAEVYRSFHAALTTPTLPIRAIGPAGTKFVNALPSPFIPLHQGIGTLRPQADRYKGLAPRDLFPMIRVRQPYD